MSTTLETDSDYADLVEADKRSIFAKALSTDLFKFSRLIVKSDTIKVNKKKESDVPNKIDPEVKEDLKDDSNKIDPDVEENMKLIFDDEDVDDSEEIFERVLKEAEEAFKRQMKLKEKNPLYTYLTQTLRPPKKASPKPRKRKSKVIEDSINIMQMFKKGLAEAETPVKPGLTVNTTAKNKRSKVKSSIKSNTLLESDRPPVKVYPAWKTTATYTPIFARHNNPRWTTDKNKMSPSNTKLTRMYTPRHIYNWIEEGQEVGIDTDFTGPSSAKSFRSDAAICQTAADNQSIISPIQSPITSSTPVRSTVVRFRPSPPECISYSSNGNYSSISSNLFLEENYDDEFNEEGLENHEIIPRNYKNYTEYYQEYSETYKPFPEKCEERYDNSKYEEDQNYPCNKNNISNQTNGDISNKSTKQPFFFEDFVRNLNNNISHNYDMEVKYSMKLKCFN